jgi:hypothetical protein
MVRKAIFALRRFKLLMEILCSFIHGPLNGFLEKPCAGFQVNNFYDDIFAVICVVKMGWVAAATTCPTDHVAGELLVAVPAYHEFALP